MSRTAIAVVIGVWILALPLMLAGYGAVLEWAKRVGSRHPEFVQQPSLGEQLRADQRRHVARWANHQGDDVA